MKFFIPHLKENQAAAEAEWSRYLVTTQAPANSKKVYTVTYHHNGSKFVATVGEQRVEFARQRGPRGGYMKNAPLMPHGVRTGTVISGIVDTGGLVWVWSYGPPFAGWDNPSMIGANEIGEIEHFEP